jgi:glycosyltransferase involved in cell wall biosynthesis
MPRLSVIMAVYNQQNFLKESIESILNQTFVDFEFIIVDDGSIDSSADMIISYSDSRIKYIKNDVNKGLIFSLNRAIALVSSTADFIARMDSDDISLPTRFEKQVDFFDSNPDIDILGSAIRLFGNEISNQDIYFPINNNEIVPSFYFMNPMAHPAIMLRTKTILSKYNYSSDYYKFEDYALWASIIGKAKFCNLNEVLLQYRRHLSNVTSSYTLNLEATLNMLLKILETVTENCGITFSKTELKNICTIGNTDIYKELPYIKVGDLISLFNNIISQQSIPDFNINVLKKQVGRNIVAYLLKQKRIVDLYRLIMHSKEKEHYISILISLIRKDKYILYI